MSGATTSANKPKPIAGTQAIAARWGKANIEAGWTALPNVLFQRQRALGLSAMDLNIILHLAGNWWDAARFPHPSVKQLAEAMDVSERTIQRHITGLQAAGYIKRNLRFKDGRSIPNVYDLSGLVKACKPFAQEAIEDRDRRREEAAARAKRKKPKLSAVPK